MSNHQSNKTFALIPAAGIGSRMNSSLPKQYLNINNKPLIWYSINTLFQHTQIERIYVVLSTNDQYWQDFSWDEFTPKLNVLHCGGETRAISVQNGLKQMNAHSDDWILVHDAARPCLSLNNLDELIKHLQYDSVGGILALPVADTLKYSEHSQRIKETISRQGIWQAQTPQMFRYGLLKLALEKNNQITDEASAIEQLGYSPQIITGQSTNFKITYPEDLILAKLILSNR